MSLKSWLRRFLYQPDNFPRSQSTTEPRARKLAAELIARLGGSVEEQIDIPELLVTGTHSGRPLRVEIFLSGQFSLETPTADEDWVVVVGFDSAEGRVVTYDGHQRWASLPESTRTPLESALNQDRGTFTISQGKLSLSAGAYVLYRDDPASVVSEYLELFDGVATAFEA